MWFNLPSANAVGFMKFGSNTVSDTTTATASGWWFADSTVVTNIDFSCDAGSGTDGQSASLYANRNVAGPSLIHSMSLGTDAADSTGKAIFLPDSSRISLVIPTVGAGTNPDYPMFKYRVHKFVRP